MKSWIDEYMEMVDDCIARESRLTEWEVNFIDSIKSRLDVAIPLSKKQIETLENIWDRTTKKG